MSKQIKNLFQKKSYTRHEYGDPTYLSFFLLWDWEGSPLFNGRATDFLETILEEPERAEKLKTFKRVHQLISTIEAKVSSKLKLSEILKGTFPMGSMTGAPKIESMNIIDEFESTKRGLYSGSVGYINPDMNFDFNVVIRSIVYRSSNKMLTGNVGSAITHKSIAEKEYEECLVMAEPMIQSLK